MPVPLPVPDSSSTQPLPPSRIPAKGRRLVESALLLLSVLLVVRAVGTEPYSVPTGSMAPALMGNHRAVTCPRCGYAVRVGVGNGQGERAGGARGPTACPNCGCDDLALDQAPVCRGDQLLVNKNVFDWRRPRRWEMAVFHCPAEPGKEFVKRVVGLPGESVQIQGGDVIIDHDLARKTLAEFKRLRVPVFDNDYQPVPDGWALRWEVRPPGGPASLEGTGLRLDGLARPGDYVWLGYRHWSLDQAKEQAIRDEYSYNGSDHPAGSSVHDFMMECDLEVLSGDGWVALGITDGLDQLTAELPIGTVNEGARLVGRQAGDAEEKVYRTAPEFALQAGKTYRVELAFVDRRATLAINGRCPFAPVDLPAAPKRDEVVRPVRVGAWGVEVRVRGFRIFRDVYYTEAGRHGIRVPVRLGAGQYFVLGDNSPNSDDSRYWSGADDQPLPVPEGAFVGKPFLVHLPSRVVQWQAFGRQQQHQAIDWGRVRWLR